jgi:hypothetical protein
LVIPLIGTKLDLLNNTKIMSITHPSNPPADAIGFNTKLSDGYELASWKQTSKPIVHNTNDAAYKVLKLGDWYLVVCAMKIAAN